MAAPSALREGGAAHGQGIVLPSEDDSHEFRDSCFPTTARSSSASSSAKKTGIAKKRYQKRNLKKYNNYNIYFMLERQLLLHSYGGGFVGDKAAIGTIRRDPHDASSLSSDVRRYVDLDLPPLCRRYADLPLSPHGWFVELITGRDEKRIHKRNHGLVPFADLARIVARNYKAIDEETRGFVNEVALRLASHCDLLKAADADEKEVKKRLKEEQEQKEFRVNAREEGGNDGGDGISIANTVNAKAMCPGMTRGIDRQYLRHQVRSLSVQSSNSLCPARDYFHQFMYPPSLMMTLPGPPPPLPFSYNSELERLRGELELAFSARIESERRVSHLKALMEVIQARKRLMSGLDTRTLSDQVSYA